MNLPFLTSTHGGNPVVVEALMASPPERVFYAWTDPDELLKWFGPKPLTSAKIDLTVGGMWEFYYDEPDGRRDTLRGEYVEITPNERLIFTWVHERTTVDGQTQTTPSSLVTITLTDVPEGTMVKLVHEAIVLESGRLGVGEGWSASFTRLTQVLAE